MQRQSAQKHLCLFLDEKLSFLKLTDEKIRKARIGVNFICKLNLLLPRLSLLTVYKCFIRPPVDYRYVSDQPNMSYLSNMIESVYCNLALAIMHNIRGTSIEKLYHELGFESFTLCNKGVE